MQHLEVSGAVRPLKWPLGVKWLMRFLDQTQRRTTLITRPEDSSRRVISSSQRPLPDNTHNRQTSMLPVGFEPTISAGERPQTHALDRAAAGTGWINNTSTNYKARTKIQTRHKIIRNTHKRNIKQIKKTVEQQ